MKTFCLTLDLKDDPVLIAEYRRLHQPDVIWPEVLNSIKSEGVIRQQIFLLGTRMVMILTTVDTFDLDGKALIDRMNPNMQAWETLMWRYQQPLPQAPEGQKWVPMEQIFDV